MTGRNVVLTDAYRLELQEDLVTYLANDRIPAALRFASMAKVFAAAHAKCQHQGGTSNNPVPLRTLLMLAIRGGLHAEVERLMPLGAREFTGDLDMAIRLWRGNHDAIAVSLIASPSPSWI